MRAGCTEDFRVEVGATSTSSSSAAGQARLARSRRLAQVIVPLAALAFALALSTTPASAGLYHPKPPVASFGPLGGACPEGKLATGTGDLSAATGSGDLSLLATGTGKRALLGSGKGDLAKGSTTISNFAKTTGAFTVGASISGKGILAGTTITTVGANTLTLSNPATETRTANPLKSGSKTITSLATSTGAFTVGASISGAGIPAGATITALGAGTLTLSAGATEAGTGSLASGSKTITNVATVTGSFTVGMRISEAQGGPNLGGSQQEGEGVFTTITAVGANTLTLSVGALAAATGAQLQAGSTEVTSLATTCGPFAVGQELSGVGIPTGTTITATAPSVLTLSNPATASASGVALVARSSFGRAQSLAFDQVAHRLFAVNYSAEQLVGFNLSIPGAYTPLAAPFPLSIPTSLNGAQTGLAVDDSGGPTQGNIYTSTAYSAKPPGARKLYGFNSTGAALGSPFPIETPTPSKPTFANLGWEGLAVDPSGNVWATHENEFSGEAYEYSPAGVLLNKVIIPSSGILSPTNIEALAFDSNGDLYAQAGNTVWRLQAPAYDHPVKFLEGRPPALAVDRTTHDLYVAFANHVSRYRPDGTLLEEFATGLGSQISGIALDEASDAVYVSTESKVHVFEALKLPDLAPVPPSDPTETTVTLHGSVHPDGVALSGCKFEWVTEAAFQASGFASLASGGEHECEPPFGSIPTTSETVVSAAIGGLSEGVHYRYRLSASNLNGTNTFKGLAPAFALARPEVETVGSPIRTANTARLDSRVDPHGIATDYHFQYISDAVYQVNLAASEPPFTGATSTSDHPAGDGDLTELVSQHLENLTPATTYHYRVLADNGAFGGAATGESMTLTTRASDQPLSHGHFPGPVGSDRAWEQVNLPDTSGNPVPGAAGVSDDGERAVYKVSGGTKVSQSGTAYDYLYARRPPGAHPTEGWRTDSVWPFRTLTNFSAWRPPSADDSLSTILALNLDIVEGTGAGLWRIPTEGGAPSKLYEATPGTYANLYLTSEDGSRALLALKGEHLDPDHASPSGVKQLYDVSSGVPQMASLLPGNTVPSCGVVTGGQGSPFPVEINWTEHTTHWVSADGSRAFFVSAGSSCGTPHLYMRDFAAAETYRVDGPPLTGPECSGALIRSNLEAVFFWTQSDLAEPDTSIVGGCDSNPPEHESTPGGDVYRYDLTTHTLTCLTCVAPGGLAANVSDKGPEGTSIAVAADGSRLYFTTTSRLLPGAPEAGARAIYRVDTETDQLAYVAPLDPSDQVGQDPVAKSSSNGSTINPDGRFFAFASAVPALDQLTGSDNGHSVQYYLYDDKERSLLCVSCPPDGSVPRAAVVEGIIAGAEPGPNMTSLAADGDFAFATPTALVDADQNTAPTGRGPSAGNDVYEWRDGRPLLVSDGITNWPDNNGPRVDAIAPSGRDLFFTEAAPLTPDALDGYTRLYDARIGGGINFPAESKPCPLEVCQGTPKGVPEEAEPGTSTFHGPGNEEEALKPCRKGKVRRKGRCVSKHHRRAARVHKHHRASHKRRAAR